MVADFPSPKKGLGKLVGECGKTIQLINIQLEKSGVRASLCAMNTHLSFAGSAGDRANHIKLAIDYVKKEGMKCDMTVFVGDFNSRNTCYKKEPLSTENSPLAIMNRYMAIKAQEKKAARAMVQSCTHAGCRLC